MLSELILAFFPCVDNSARTHARAARAAGIEPIIFIGSQYIIVIESERNGKSGNSQRY